MVFKVPWGYNGPHEEVLEVNNNLRVWNDKLAKGYFQVYFVAVKIAEKYFLVQ